MDQYKKSYEKDINLFEKDCFGIFKEGEVIVGRTGNNLVIMKKGDTDN